MQSVNSKTGQTRFYVIELHVSPSACQTQISADSPYRVFTHSGTLGASSDVRCVLCCRLYHVKLIVSLDG